MSLHSKLPPSPQVSHVILKVRLQLNPSVINNQLRWCNKSLLLALWLCSLSFWRWNKLVWTILTNYNLPDRVTLRHGCAWLASTVVTNRCHFQIWAQGLLNNLTTSSQLQEDAWEITDEELQQRNINHKRTLKQVTEGRRRWRVWYSCRERETEWWPRESVIAAGEEWWREVCVSPGALLSPPLACQSKWNEEGLSFLHTWPLTWPPATLPPPPPHHLPFSLHLHACLYPHFHPFSHLALATSISALSPKIFYSSGGKKKTGGICVVKINDLGAFSFEL